MATWKNRERKTVPLKGPTPTSKEAGAVGVTVRFRAMLSGTIGSRVRDTTRETAAGSSVPPPTKVAVCQENQLNVLPAIETQMG